LALSVQWAWFYVVFSSAARLVPPVSVSFRFRFRFRFRFLNAKEQEQQEAEDAAKKEQRHNDGDKK